MNWVLSFVFNLLSHIYSAGSFLLAIFAAQIYIHEVDEHPY